MSRPTTSLLCLLAATIAALIGGCFNPTVKDAGFLCDAAQTPSCPTGFACVDGLCRNSSTPQSPSADLAASSNGPTDGGADADMAHHAHDMASTPGDLAMSGGNCAHSLCTTGVKLMNGCDPCVTQICAQDNYCCVTKWSAQCVQEVTSICSRTCP